MTIPPVPPAQQPKKPRDPDEPESYGFFIDYVLWPVSLYRRIKKHRESPGSHSTLRASSLTRTGSAIADGLDEFGLRHSSPGPFGTRISAGRLLLPIRIFLPLACLIGAMTLFVFSIFIGVMEPDSGKPIISAATKAQRSNPLLIMAASTGVLALLALAIKRVRGWLGLTAFASLAVGFGMIMMWF